MLRGRLGQDPQIRYGRLILPNIDLLLFLTQEK